MNVRFDFERSGGIQQSIKVRTAAAVIYPSGFNIAVDLLWLFLVLCLYGRQIINVIRHFRDKMKVMDGESTISDRPSICNFWNVLDWVTIFASVVLAAIFLFLAKDTGQIADAIGELPQEAPPAGSSAKALEAYHDLWGDVLERVIHLVAWTEWLNLSSFWYTMFVSLQFFRSLRGQPKL